jgi:NAD-dependent dihydropyrimidine dehydrogenase PreA subunit
LRPEDGRRDKFAERDFVRRNRDLPAPPVHRHLVLVPGDQQADDVAEPTIHLAADHHLGPDGPIEPGGAIIGLGTVVGTSHVRDTRPGSSNGGRSVTAREDRFVTYVIAQPCVNVKDKACIDECPVDCIYEGKRSMYIHPDECVDCGACEPVCPVEAIYYEDDVPEQWSQYQTANVEFFSELGSPGGAAKLGMIDRDHPIIAALDPQNGA